MRDSILICLLSLVLVGCAATDQEVGTVLGTTAAGAAIGALGGAALDPWDRNRGATSGALAGAAVGGAIGFANVAQQRQQYQPRYSYYPPQPTARPYTGSHCTVTQARDPYGRITTTERCTGNGPSYPPGYY
jgi:hypothetical protein